ncbi:thioeseterase [Litorivicinus lipolyticus]|uniref:Thioeseterase n=1 Tax=Litorivicinus lipolyticus TaxID=418701 RepID=A0A5Q2Q728_9GAMM|nr:acyl-CoA thioesterase [Litorivicinus lipolyticus]QGG79688.1 thioeseterase [Litorivicinus lipolyticus]
MYPFIRTLMTLVRAKSRPALAIDGISVMHFRAMPWDIDIFGEVNNGRQLTLFEQGRWDLAVRIGLLSLLKRKGWGLVVAGSSVRYRKRIRMLDAVECRTQCVGVDGRWFYMSQSFWVDGQPCSHALFRTAVTDRGKTLDNAQVTDAIGEQWTHPTPDWVLAWDRADHERPWPPNPLALESV